jgi:hypothetical protein
MGVSPRSKPNRRIAGAMLAAWCSAPACGRLGYDAPDLMAIEGAGGTGIPPVTTGGGVDGGGTSGAAGTGGMAGAPVDGGCLFCDPILYWRFDETSGTQAIDSSGHGFDGTYIGSPMAPSPSALVPPAITFADPASRQFVVGKQQAVQLANAPVALKPANDITLAAWYRSTATDTVGGGVISMGDNYVLFLHRGAGNGTIELSKVQPQPADGGFVWTRCLGMGAGYLDGNWHHLAGVISSAGMKLYFDGSVIATSPDSSSIVYPLGTDFFVGMHGNGIAGFNFDGNIDEVRIYDRVLSDVEIGLLAQGGG